MIPPRDSTTSSVLSAQSGVILISCMPKIPHMLTVSICGEMLQHKDFTINTILDDFWQILYKSLLLSFTSEKVFAGFKGFIVKQTKEEDMGISVRIFLFLIGDGKIIAFTFYSNSFNRWSLISSLFYRF